MPMVLQYPRHMITILANSAETLYDDVQAFCLQGHRQVDQGEVPDYSTLPRILLTNVETIWVFAMDDYIFEAIYHDIT
jgi:hypothetical protein